jgi:hypothetical protein
MFSSSKPSKAIDTRTYGISKNSANMITITEKVNLTKNQYEVLKTICDTYEESVIYWICQPL